MFRWNAFALPWMLVAIALFALAAVIFSRQRASRIAVLFCAMIGLVAIWFSAFAAMYSSVSPFTATLFARAGLAAICLLPAAIYDFTATAFRLASRRRPMIVGAWAASAGFAALCAFTASFASGVSSHAWGFYPVGGPLAIAFVVYFIAVLAAQLVDTVAELHRTTDHRRRGRIAKLLFCFVIAYFAALDWLPMFGVEMRPIAYVPLIAFMAVAWGMIRSHRLAPITAARAAQEIVHTMADALFVIDANGSIRVINDAVYALFGYRESDLIGRSIDRLEETHADETISRTLRDLARRGPIRDQERILRRIDGQGVNVSVSISPIGEDEAQEGAVVIARDIRERKRAEEDLRTALTRLEHSNRELEDFAYVASHDLQEPLRKIQAFGDLLKSKHAEALPEQARDYIERMQSAAKRMQILINDLLSFSRVTTKAQPFVEVDLAEIAREVAHDLELRAHDSGGHVVVGELPVIDADPLQMRQLLQNLAGNGLKFHRDGVPAIVEIRGNVDDGHCRITVSDNGIGFDEKYAERIFTMFERLHSRDKYEGTGIGLAICRKIAERHGGEIRAHSQPGHGATFVVTLPVGHAGRTNE